MQYIINAHNSLTKASKVKGKEVLLKEEPLWFL